MNRRYDKSIQIFLISLWVAVPACREPSYSCANGVCTRAAGHDCDIDCKAPPCHIICKDPGTYCDAVCGNGDCTCDPGSECHFDCQSPPCHVSCKEDTTCTGVCGNGRCSCAAGSTCAFDCMAGPCHVDCEGDNESCNGVCANGSCTCGPGSSCRFSCMDGNCKAHCEAGSQCILDCPAGQVGGQGCTFDTCAAGEPEICSNNTMVCGIECPVDADL